jgi:hypothetical protein
MIFRQLRSVLIFCWNRLQFHKNLRPVFINEQEVISSDLLKMPLATLQFEPMSREKLIWVVGDQVFHFSFEHGISQSFTHSWNFSNHSIRIHGRSVTGLPVIAEAERRADHAELAVLTQRKLTLDRELRRLHARGTEE